MKDSSASQPCKGMEGEREEVVAYTGVDLF